MIFLKLILHYMEKVKPINTIIVSANEWGFQYVLLESNMWYIQRIGNENIKKIKNIAFYQTSPVCAITCYAKVDKIVYNSGQNHYDFVIKGKLIKIKPIELDKNKPHLAPQGTKYTSIKRLLKARKYSDLVDKK